MHRITKLTAAIALSALLISGVTACSTSPEAAPETAAAVDAADLMPAKAADVIEAFVAATTSDAIAAAFPDKADKATFAKAIKHIDPAAPADKTSKALADFALVKVSAPKAKVTVDIDTSRVKVTDQIASIPASAIVVKADGKKVAGSDALAKQVTDLIFAEGSWMIAFPAGE